MQPMARRPSAPLTVTVDRNIITVSDGTQTREALCATPSSARGLATRIQNNPAFAAQWMKTPEPVQLDLPLEVGPGVRVE